jgi:hypothetical protein
LNLVTFIERAKKFNNSLNVQEFTDKVHSLDQMIPLSLLVLFEKNRRDANGTYFKAFIQGIVERKSTSIFTISESTMNEFQHSFTRHQRNTLIEYSKRIYHQIMEEKLTNYLPFVGEENSRVKWSEILTLKELQWAMSVSFSRTFLMYNSVPNHPGYYSLCPLIDYVNTAQHWNSRYDQGLDPEKRYIIANRDIEEGEEISIEYSSLNNYFLDYAFCMNPCLHCVYDFLFPMKDEQDLPPSLRLSINSTIQDIPMEFLKKVQQIYMKNTINDESEYTSSKPFPLVYMNEILTHLKNLFESSLSKYATSVEEDSKILLTKKDLDYEVKCAIIIRRDEKNILKHIIEQCEKQMNQPMKEQQEEEQNSFTMNTQNEMLELIKILPIVKILPNTVEFKETPSNGMGVYATSDIQPGEVNSKV